MKWNVFLCVVVIFMLFGCNQGNRNCLEIRAAFDVGSGVTRMKIARVNKCLKKIEKILFEETIPVSYKEDLLQLKSGKTGYLSHEIMDIGFEKLLELKNKAMKFKPRRWIGVATSAFRTARNSGNYFKMIEKKLGIRIKTITQEKEAKIGLRIASMKTGKKDNEIIAWDIGGGSMQMITGKMDGGHHYYGGNIGAVSFKEMIIRKIQKKKSKKIFSPNPIRMKDFNSAVSVAKHMARKGVDNKLSKIIKGRVREIIGIGGLHYFCIYKQSSGVNETYHRHEIENILPKKVLMTDAELGGKYAPTDVSNLALVLGHMKELDIKKLRTLKVNLNEGLLVYPEFAMD